MTSPRRRPAVSNNNKPKHKLTITFPKQAWNSFQPQAQSPSRKGTRSTSSSGSSSTEPSASPTSSTATKDNISNPKLTLHPPIPIKDPTFAPTPPRSCRIKFWTFHHGGPKRAIKGTMRNTITYETPCLHSTCASCWKWHPKLMRLEYLSVELPVVDGSGDEFAVDGSSGELDVPNSRKTDTESRSSEIDPRILSDTWREYDNEQDERDSASDTSSIASSSETRGLVVLTPVKEAFESDMI